MSQNCTGYGCYYNFAEGGCDNNMTISPNNASLKPLTRGIYDQCAYNHRLMESTSPLGYQINPIAYESCHKCHQAYPGFVGHLGGVGFGIGPDRVDMESDIRGQTRLLSRCPSKKYDPTKYKNCNTYEKFEGGLPCGDNKVNVNDMSYMPDCTPGILPTESLDSRNFNGCSDLNGIFINRFDHVCANPQDPNRVFFYKNTNRRLGEETRLDMKDRYPYGPRGLVDCMNMKLPNREPCSTGGLGCRAQKDFNKNIYL